MNQAEHPHCSIAAELTFAASGLCLLDRKKTSNIMPWGMLREQPPKRGVYGVRTYA